MEKWCPELSGSVGTQSNAVYRDTGFHFLCFSAFWQFSYTCEWRYSDAFRHFGPTYIIVWPASHPASYGRPPYGPPCRTIHKKNSGIPKTDSRRVEFNLPPFSDLWCYLDFTWFVFNARHSRPLAKIEEKKEIATNKSREGNRTKTGNWKKSIKNWN